MSVMPYLRALLSAITLFGGHFLNRRFDRVVLVGAPVALCLIVIFGLATTDFFYEWQPGYGIWSLRIFVALNGAVLVLSTVLTFRDARQPPGKLPTITVRVIRLPLTLLGTLVVLYTVGATVSMFYTPPYASDLVMFTPTGDWLNFGEGNGEGQNDAGAFMTAPPDGHERLRGRITLNGVGISGAELTLKLNGKYRIDSVKSDSHGGFKLALPAGKWRINDIVVTDWPDRPAKRDLILVSSREPVRGPGLYSRFNMDTVDGLEVSLPATPDSVPVQLEYRDALSITWPLPVAARAVDITTAAISWQPVNNASEYEIQIKHVDTERGSPVILTRRVSGTSLPLAFLPQKAAKAAEDRYSVHVFAFDAGGHLLTESGAESKDRQFVLTGAVRLAREQQYVGFDGPRMVIFDDHEDIENCSAPPALADLDVSPEVAAALASGELATQGPVHRFLPSRRMR